VHTKRTERQKQCDECSALVEETKGRMVILDQKSPTPTTAGESNRDGFHWSVLYNKCVRDWRDRGLRREGLAPEEVTKRFYREYPIK